MSTDDAIDASPPPASWGVVGTVVWGVGVAIVFVALQTFAMVAYLRSTSEGLSEEAFRALMQASHANGVVLSLATLLTTALCVPLVIGIAKLKRGARIADYLALRPLPLPALGRWLGVTAAFILASDLLTWALGKPVVPEFMQSAYASADPAWLIWLAVVLAAPLFEEVFFRGFLYKGLVGPLKPAGAIVVIAVVWSSIHVQYDVYGMVTVFAMGLLLGAARHRSQSLFPPLAMHMLMNLVASVETAFVVGRVA